MFDLSEWWDKVGCQAYQLIFPAVPLVIPVPSSNGYQERVFSACTYFDGDLKQRLKDTRYEMKVLTAVNEQLVDDLSPIDPVVHWAALRQTMNTLISMQMMKTLISMCS